MKMDGWEDYLHTSFYGEHVLFPGLRLNSLGAFICAAFLAAALCLLERSLTFALSRHWWPFRAVRQSRTRRALWRAGLYAVATLLRLLYMLLSMTFHVWLILIIVFSLAAGQFFIEYFEQPHDSDPRRYVARPTLPFPQRKAPGPSCSACHIALSSSPPSTMRKARSRAKPAGLFIHPNESNLARADAVAVELGLHGSTEHARASSDSDGDGLTWERGHGRDAARALLGGAQQVQTNVRGHAKSDSQRMLFQVGDSGSESDD
ncbi:hypothetical protein EDB84DRAFT_1270378 [Lactarius hengduanensis]|nr:hypothetical protein EDB84DRAFT_1270378 [Lactarius hengduanensis]